MSGFAIFGSNFPLMMPGILSRLTIEEALDIPGSKSVLHGILYDPGGKIELPGSSNTFYGSLIGDRVTLNGSSLKIIFTADYCASLSFAVTKHFLPDKGNFAVKIDVVKWPL